MTYRLTDDWLQRVEDVRNEVVRSQTAASWRRGTKHGLEESSASRDIVAFVSRRINQTATRVEIVQGIPGAFQQTDSKTLDGSAQEYLRELVKMNILEKTD
jgi:hypothetical protein